MEKKKKEEIALFKFGLLAPVINENVKSQMKYFIKISQKEYEVPYIGKRKYKARTFKTWLNIYRKGGLDALMPKERSDKGISKKINEELGLEIKRIMEFYCRISGSNLYRILISEGKIKMGEMSELTLRKYINDNNLKAKSSPTPRKKFEKEHVNDLWICDVMHGIYIKKDNKKCKTYLIAAVDDHSRMLPVRHWAFNESSVSLEKALKEGIKRFGIPKALYCDNGSLFVSYHLKLACARLGIALIHSKPYDSPSRGKIERFFRGVRQRFLPFLIPDDIDIKELNDKFEKWLDKEYVKHFHHGIKTRPIDKYIDDLKIINIVRVSEKELDLAFQMTITRLVKNDATVSINGCLYEAPSKFIGKKVEIRYPSDKPNDLTIYEEDKPAYRITKLNIYENANIPAFGIKFNQEVKNDS